MFKLNDKVKTITTIRSNGKTLVPNHTIGIVVYEPIVEEETIFVEFDGYAPETNGLVACFPREIIKSP